MKKLLLLVRLAIGVQLAARAADPERNDPSGLSGRAAQLTRTMAAKMKLDEGQYIKLKDLNMRMLVTMEDLKVRFAAEPEIRDIRMAEAQVSYHYELASMLRPQQLTVYRQSQETMTALGASGSN